MIFAPHQPSWVGRTVRAAVALVLAATVVACSGSSNDEPEGGADTGPVEEATTVTVEHALGTTEVPTDAARIVSAGVSIAGHLLAIDAPVTATAGAAPGPLTDADGFFIQWADRATEQGIEPLAGPAPNVEEILAAEPDLVVASAVGADALSADAYEELSTVVPTIAFDVTTTPWAELVTELGRALDRADRAEAVVADFDALVAETAPTLDTSHPVVAFTANPDGYGVFTPASAHGQLLAALGLEVVDLGADGSASAVEEDRADVDPIALERVDLFGDATLLFVLADQAAMEDAIERSPVLATTPGATEGRTVALGFDSFRLDPFSATHVVEVLAEALAA